MGQTEYLHDKGTDKLIADVLAFDPTKVNAGEEDEIDTAKPVWDSLNEAFKDGTRSASMDAVNIVWANREFLGLTLEHIEAITKLIDAEQFRKYGAKYSIRPSGTTRKG